MTLRDSEIVTLHAVSTLDRFAFGPFGKPCLVIELAGERPAGNGWIANLPCPVIGVGRDSHPAAPLCDVVVEDQNDLSRLVDNCRSAPIAAMTLVQMLRATAGLHVTAALQMESLAYATLQGGAENRAWLARRPPPLPAPQATGAPPLLVARNGAVLGLTLNRPQAFNAVNLPLRDALAEALALPLLDPSITSVHLRGAGRCFCTGGALEEFGTAPDQAVAHAVRSTAGPAFGVAAIAPLCTAFVHGACIGAGAEMASLCGRVAARPDSFFQLPEIRFGLIAGSGGTCGITRRIGRQRAGYLMLSGRRIGAAQALAWGLIDEISPAS